MFHTTYPYGHDLGNSETTGYTQTKGGEQVLTLSSALHRGSYDELMRIVGATSTNDGAVSILNARSHAIRFRDQSNEEREVFVGELAIKQAGNVTIDQLTGRGQVQRYWDYRSLGLLLATSGTLIADQEYGLSVVTNIPVATHTKSNTDRVRAALEGDHHFTLDGRKRIAHVAVRKVIIEAASANILYGDGNRKMGTVDIGGRTTDVYMVDGLAPVQDLCKSFDVGVETASDRIKAIFEETFDYPLSIRDTRALLRAYLNGKQYQNIALVSNANANNVEVERLVYQTLREVGQDIVSRIRGAWNLSFRSGAIAGDAQVIIAIGGGAYYFREELAALFTKRLQVPPAPEKINAQSCFHLARLIVQRDTAVTKVVG